MAFHQASGSAQSMRDGALSKRLGAGFAARSAVLSGFLAADGLDSTVRTLEGNAGLFSLYERDEVKPEEILADFGSHWHVPEYSFKPFPGCRANHTVIGLGIELNKAGIRPEDISVIEVRVSKLNFMTIGEKYDVSRNSVVHAQFNAAYSFARALTDGRVDLRSYERPYITEARIAALAQRTEVRPDEMVDERAIEPARVRIRLTNGGEKFAESMTMPGSPDSPMSESDFLRKFHNCVESGLGQPASAVAPLIEDIKRLESLPDVRTLIAKFPVSA
jgi:2-methylcitrate dehydratase PrpD